MDHDSQLKLQAYLDAELPENEAREVANWLARDKEATALLVELRNTRQSLVGFEAGVKLPESREFYWSKIQRQIGRESTARPAPARAPWFARLQRFLVPISGLAAVAIVLMLTVLRPSDGGALGETEVSASDMGALTFRDESERMTMVWLYDRGDSQFTDGSPAATVNPQ
jgi:anti-sigma factor RsiW